MKLKEGASIIHALSALRSAPIRQSDWQGFAECETIAKTDAPGAGLPRTTLPILLEIKKFCNSFYAILTATFGENLESPLLDRKSVV